MFVLFYLPVIGQVILSNPSFEDEAQDATIPQGWFGCEDGTTPDILPGYWGVNNIPADGSTFMGLITRANGSFESVGQRLSNKLERGECYRFSIDLAHSKQYSGYNDKIRLRIWMSKKKCKREQLVFESPVIDHSRWKTYNIDFNAEGHFKYILIEAYHSYEPFSHEANILIDNMSTINRCSRAQLTP